jgi:hypothetical protein
MCVNNNEKHGFKDKDIHDRINYLSKSVNESNIDNADLPSKHRVIVVGDSHIRGYGGNLTSLLCKN